MARYTESVCRLCRRENLKMFLKGERCYSDKCGFERRGYAPGMHGAKRTKLSDYGLQLREKQKVKRMYGVLESQFRRTFKEAARMSGITGENLLMLLERRLDNVIYRLGFSNSRNQARQLLSHEHFLVNGRKVTIPSFLVKVGDVISVKEKSRNEVSIQDAIKNASRKGKSSWLECDESAFKGVVNANPVREEITIPINELLIVELYSK